MTTAALPAAQARPDGADAGLQTRPVEQQAGPLGRPFVSAIVFATATAGQRVLGFLLLPVYTHALGPGTYGKLSVALSVSAAAAILFTFGMDYSINRTYFALADDRARREHLVSSAWVFTIVAPLACAIVVSAAAWPFLAGNSVMSPAMLTLALFAAALGTAYAVVPLAILRAEQRLRAFVALVVINAIVTTCSIIVAVLVLHAGEVGWLVATALGSGAALATAALIMPFRWPAPFEWHEVASTLKLGLPLVPHFVSQWALQLADRIVLAAIVTAAVLGRYSLAANLALPVLIGVQAINQGFLPTYGRARYDEKAKSALRNTVVQQVAVVCLIGSLAALLGPPFASLIAPHDFAGAGQLIPWFALGYVFLGIYLIPMNGVSLGAGVTRWIWVFTVSSAGINLGIIAWLVPTQGVIWGAVSSAIAYAFLLVAIALYSRRPGNPVTYDWSRLARVVIFPLVIYVFGAALTPSSGAVALAVRASLGALLVVTMVALFGLTPRGLRRVPGLWRMTLGTK